jgi:hypothetical protein
VFSKYSRNYALSILEHSRKYYPLLKNVNGIQLAKPTIRNNIINALTVLSRYFDCYEEFKNAMKTHGIKRHKPDAIETFNRIFNGKEHTDLGKWYRDALAILNDNEKLYLKYAMLSGLRAAESVQSFNLIVTLGDNVDAEYYNAQTKFIEHWRYPKLYIRNSKKCYVTAVPEELISEISQSQQVSYNAIAKRIRHNGLRMRVKQLRSFWATFMREHGILEESINLCQGRINWHSIFLKNYFKMNPEELSSRILKLLPKLEKKLLAS